MLQTAMSQNLPPVTLEKSEYEAIADLIDNLPSRLSHVSALLEAELVRARIVRDGSMPHDIVRMQSRVAIRQPDADGISQIELVYPDASNFDEGRVPITSLLGAALIGLPPGAKMKWQDRHGKLCELTIVHVEPGIAEK